MIEFKNVTKKYDANKFAVDNVSFTVESGSFVCLIGTSGSGKTTCMRMINRMITPSEGVVSINGVDTQNVNEVALRRKIGYVIQQIGLMPHMTIYENIVMVPRLLKWPEEKMRKTAEALMARIDLPVSLFDAYPSELSGGMQQRIGVIRALAADQEIILMDEPFGALDPITRSSLQQLIRTLQKDMHKTIVFVTHDMDEALALSDKIVILHDGKIVQQGSPKDILTTPANEFVKELVGEKRLSQAVFEYETVSKIMIKDPVTVAVDSSMQHVAQTMRKYHIDDVLVVDASGKLVGSVDLKILTTTYSPQHMIKDIMKKEMYIHIETSIRDALYYIQDLGYRNLPVVDDNGVLVGLVTRGAIVGSVYDALWSQYAPETVSIGATEDHSELQGENS